MNRGDTRAGPEPRRTPPMGGQGGEEKKVPPPASSPLQVPPAGPSSSHCLLPDLKGVTPAPSFPHLSLCLEAPGPSSSSSFPRMTVFMSLCPASSSLGNTFPPPASVIALVQPSSKALVSNHCLCPNQLTLQTASFEAHIHAFELDGHEFE